MGVCQNSRAGDRNLIAIQQKSCGGESWLLAFNPNLDYTALSVTVCIRLIELTITA